MKHNILIADDVKINRKLVMAVLKDMDNIILHEAQDGIEATDIIDKIDISLIILDLMMPVKDGFQVLHEIKSSEKHREIPVIIYSTLTSIDNIEKALTMGAYDYFTKPLTIEQMKVILPLKIKNALEAFIQRKMLKELNQRLKKEMETVRYLGLHDSLTGLYNRTFFDKEMEQMERRLEKGQDISILSIDVDGLKVVNDMFGHKTGDELLISAARIIDSSFGKKDIVARIGGDEFLVMLPDTNAQIANKKRNELIDLVSRYNGNNPTIPLSMSIGVASNQEGDTSIYDIYQRADDNMYEHKMARSKSSRSKSIDLLMDALGKKDYMSHGHGERLTIMAERMADILNIEGDERKNLILLAKVHDIGKIGISDCILNKSETLTKEEFDIIKEHSKIGHDIANRSKELIPVSKLILHHHEYYDGKGYPSNLKGDDIPIECRIISVLDAFDAMTHNRPYRLKKTREEAIKELQRCAGSQFDPHIEEVFVNEGVFELI